MIIYSWSIRKLVENIIELFRSGSGLGWFANHVHYDLDQLRGIPVVEHYLLLALEKVFFDL